MARVKGTTKRVGKTSTSPAAGVAADRIDRPHGGKKTRSVGPKMPGETEALSGRAGPGKPVRQIGPSAIRPAGGGRQTRVVARESNFEDKFAVFGLGTPYARQNGSVKVVGPVDASFARLVERGRSAIVPLSGRVPKSNVKISKTPLLKSGAGRAHEWSKSVGGPGTMRAGAKAGGAYQESMLVSGRRRGRFSPEAIVPTLEAPGNSVVPGA